MIVSISWAALKFDFLFICYKLGVVAILLEHFDLLNGVLWIFNWPEVHGCLQWCSHLRFHWCSDQCMFSWSVLVDSEGIHVGPLSHSWSWLRGTLWLTSWRSLQSFAGRALWDAACGEPLVSVVRDLSLLLKQQFVHLVRALLPTTIRVAALRTLQQCVLLRRRSARYTWLMLAWGTRALIVGILIGVAASMAKSLRSLRPNWLVFSCVFEASWGWTQALDIILLSHWRFSTHALEHVVLVTGCLRDVPCVLANKRTFSPWILHWELPWSRLILRERSAILTLVGHLILLLFGWSGTSYWSIITRWIASISFSESSLGRTLVLCASISLTILTVSAVAGSLVAI